MAQHRLNLCFPVNLTYFKYKQCGAVYEADAPVFADSIFRNNSGAQYSFDDIDYSAIADTMFVSRWIMDSSNLQCLPSSVRQLFRTDKYYSLSRFSVAPIAAFIERIRWSLWIIRCCLIRLPPIQNCLLRQCLLAVMKIADSESPLRLSTSFYFNFMSGFTSSDVAQLPVLSDESVLAINFPWWISLNFDSRITWCVNSILHAVYSVNLRNYDGSINTALIKYFVEILLNSFI